MWKSFFGLPQVLNINYYCGPKNVSYQFTNQAKSIPFAPFLFGHQRVGVALVVCLSAT